MKTNQSQREFIHPEIREGEVFFTASTLKDFKNMPWKTKRKGTASYDGDGNLLSVKDWFPVFIHTKELEDTGSNLIIIRRKFREEMLTLS